MNYCRILAEVMSMSSSMSVAMTQAGMSLIKVLHQLDPIHKLSEGKGASSTVDESLDSLTYLLDCAATWHSLVTCRPGDVFVALAEMKETSTPSSSSSLSAASNSLSSMKSKAKKGKQGDGSDSVPFNLPSLFIQKLAICYERLLPHYHHGASTAGNGEDTHVAYMNEYSGYYLINIFHEFLIWCGQTILFKLEEEDLQAEAEKMAEGVYSLLLGLCQEDLDAEFQQKCSLLQSTSHIRNKGSFIGDYDQCYALSTGCKSGSGGANLQDTHLLSVAFDKVGFDYQRMKFLGDVICSCHQVEKPSISVGNDGGGEATSDVNKFQDKEPTEAEMDELVTLLYIIKI
jgi:hypothetical protein